MTDTLPLTENAKMLHDILDQLTSAIVGRLISERLIDYAGQPGETIEYAGRCVADELATQLPNIDIVAMCRVHNCKPSVSLKDGE